MAKKIGKKTSKKASSHIKNTKITTPQKFDILSVVTKKNKKDKSLVVNKDLAKKVTTLGFNALSVTSTPRKINSPSRKSLKGNLEVTTPDKPDDCSGF